MITRALKTLPSVAAVALMTVLTMPTMACSAETPLREASGPAIEYDSVSAARAALRAKPDVVFTVANGWDIATDEPARTIWSFSPHDYAAYPAVVKRQVVQERGGVSIKMSVRCEASKTSCDDLVRTFSRMNGFELPR